MINKISPHPSLLKRGREKGETTQSITRRALFSKKFFITGMTPSNDENL
jgi:hypothetical protein